LQNAVAASFPGVAVSAPVAPSSEGLDESPPASTVDGGAAPSSYGSHDPARATDAVTTPARSAMRATDCRRRASARIHADVVERDIDIPSGPIRNAVEADGKRHDITQTERIGPFLGGTVKVMEGRGYDPDGRVSFNALGVLSWDNDKRAYSLRSYAMGLAGDFALVPKADGYVWTIPAGPGTTIRYTATIQDGRWREVGERIVEGKAPVQFFEMNLVRVGEGEGEIGAGAGRSGDQRSAYL
jgi:hypothetical protein